jgi:hypothetical protein
MERRLAADVVGKVPPLGSGSRRQGSGRHQCEIWVSQQTTRQLSQFSQETFTLRNSSGPTTLTIVYFRRFANR